MHWASCLSAILSVVQDVPSLSDLKVMYYNTLIRYHRKFNDYLEICRAYKAMYESRDIAEDPEKWKSVRPVLAGSCVWS